MIAEVRGAPLVREHALALLKQMLLIRRFEEKSAELYTLGRIQGFLHLYIGEEAVAVGAMQTLTSDDNIVSTYREHGHALVRGLSPGVVMAEMYGKANGCCRGRGGSMHLFDVSRRFYGGNAIVGGGLPLAVGLALADKLQARPRVTACIFGDGAVAEGEFHESLNLAALWKLPVLFLCENNQYAMGTHVTRHQAETDIYLKARGYGLPGVAVDGMDGVERAVDLAPDLILMDIVMPRLDGFSACQVLRRHPATALTPIIMVSSRDDEHNVELGFQRGATDFIAKPADREELLAKVESWLAVAAAAGLERVR